MAASWACMSVFDFGMVGLCVVLDLSWWLMVSGFMSINGWEMMFPFAFLAAIGVRVANELGAENGQVAIFATSMSVFSIDAINCHRPWTQVPEEAEDVRALGEEYHGARGGGRDGAAMPHLRRRWKDSAFLGKAFNVEATYMEEPQRSKIRLVV
ncbi:hypothetical protein NL676_026105 [Syzygium grande]|nr:hypothetical protein NL676_026105 [Syzygium grande]